MTVALDLFEEQGFEATTVAQIAAAAGVTPMTFFRYFPSKESVILDDPYDPVMAAAAVAQPRDLPPLVRVARGVREAWARVPEPDSELVRRRVRVCVASPGLRTAAYGNTWRSASAIAEALVADGVPALPAHAAAAAVMAALTAALFEWATQPGLELAGTVLTVLDLLEKT